MAASMAVEEPTVAGLTGAQWRQLALWAEENDDRCSYILFERDPKGPEERCFNEREPGSRYCEDHRWKGQESGSAPADAATSSSPGGGD